VRNDGGHDGRHDSRLDGLLRTTRLVRRGESLFRARDPFQSVYTVEAGSFKTVTVHRCGREQVTGFHVAGEALGLDGICAGYHDFDTVALEDSRVCVIPFARLEGLCAEVRPLQQHLHRVMSAEIVRHAKLAMLLATMTAEQRIATFLLSLSERLDQRGMSPTEFSLRMTREEIGSYLGLTLETVSRTLSKFRRRRLVDAHGKRIRLLDLDALKCV